MIYTGTILFVISAILPVIVSVVLLFFSQKNETRLSYMTQQVIIGVIFGALAVLGTEWGITVRGAIINCRDAAVLCAGLIFGGPAGIIAGVIGGVERFLAVAWGASAYTQISCSLATVFTGFLAAAIRRFLLDNKRPSWVIGFVAGLVIEALCLVTIVVTHLDDLSDALNTILAIGPAMLLANSVAVMLAMIAVTIAARGGIKKIPPEEKSVRNTFQGRLLASFIVAFTLFSLLVYEAETIVCRTANVQYLEQNIISVQTMDLDDIALEAAISGGNGDSFQRIGDTGYFVLSRLNDGVIVSAPDSLYGKTMDEINLGQPAETNPSPFTIGAVNCSYLYSATVDGIACECMDSFQDSYRITAVYPVEEGYLDRDRSFIMTLLIQILLFAVIFTLSDIVINKDVVRPIRKVNKSLQDITDGNLNTVVDVRLNLEFTELSDGINATVDALQEYTRESKRRIEQDLELAHSIQHAALPKHFPPYPGRKEMDIFACMHTAREIGGDFYDFYFSRRNTLCFLVADVSGKGIPAAMFMMRAKTLVKDLAESGLPLDEVVKRTNEQLRVDNKSATFVTLWCGSIDLETGLVTYVNAGHNPPIFCHSNGTAEPIKCKHDFVLGIAKNASYERQELQLQEGDTLFLYTDGVTEAMNDKEELFGGNRLCASLSDACSRPVEEICDTVMASLDGFVQDAPQADDITMLVLRFNGGCKKDSFTIPAKMEYLEQVTSLLIGKLREEKADVNTLRRLSVVIDELFNNIVSYAYPDGDGDIEVRTSVGHIGKDDESKIAFELTLIDKGKPFNPLERTTPNTQASAKDRMHGGYGIMIVRKLMDTVEYRREGDRNVLSMTLTFDPEHE